MSLPLASYSKQWILWLKAVLTLEKLSHVSALHVSRVGSRLFPEATFFFYGTPLFQSYISGLGDNPGEIVGSCTRHRCVSGASVVPVGQQPELIHAAGDAAGIVLL